MPDRDRMVALNAKLKKDMMTLYAKLEMRL